MRTNHPNHFYSNYHSILFLYCQEIHKFIFPLFTNKLFIDSSTHLCHSYYKDTNEYTMFFLLITTSLLLTKMCKYQRITILNFFQNSFSSRYYLIEDHVRRPIWIFSLCSEYLTSAIMLNITNQFFLRDWFDLHKKQHYCNVYVTSASGA